jgi:quercetin dioxygenase-like cupin family protein
VSSRHLVAHAADADLVLPPPLVGHCEGFRRWTIVGEANGAVHTGFAISEFEPGGSVDAHVHAYEETFFVLDGELILRTTEGSFLLRAGDYALVPLAQVHALRNRGPAAARIAAMSAPQPRSRFGGDTFFVAPLPGDGGEPEPVDVRDPRCRSFGHIDAENMDPANQTQDRLQVSASMRTALLVYSGITVKMMSDPDLGAQLSTMFMVQYERAGVAGPHDHPFEETYLIIDGEVDATFDGDWYRLGPGDAAWAGVGCVHSFSNPEDVPVRWLETQAPQPPARHSYRFARDWDHLRAAIGPADEREG